MEFENECFKLINQDHAIYFYNSLRMGCSIKSTQNANPSCNFDGIITHKNKYLGTCEFKNFHMPHNQFTLFPLQLSKIHLAKQGVPFFLLVKCSCGTILYYRFKKAHLKRFEMCKAWGYKYKNQDSDELFFHIPRENFKILKKDETIFLQKFYIDSKCHKQIIDDTIMKRIPKVILKD